MTHRNSVSPKISWFPLQEVYMQMEAALATQLGVDE